MRTGEGSRGVRWQVVAGGAAALAVIGVAVWVLLSRDGGLLDGGPDAPHFSFEIAKVESAGVDGRGSDDALSPAADEVHETLDELYVGGFVDPDRWEGGSFPDLTEAFAGDAVESARADVGELTLGADAERISFVDPRLGRLEIRFLLGEEGNPFAAWATTLFRARGDVDDGGEVAIEHRGRYLLRPVEDRWLIVGYDVRGRLRPGSAKATP